MEKEIFTVFWNETIRNTKNIGA